MIWTLAFWQGAAERLIKTVAQTLAALVATDAVGILDVDWQSALSVAALAGVQYDRVALLLIPIVRELRDRLDRMENQS